MQFTTRKAKRQRRPLKINLEGLSGSGKSFTALRLAFAMKRAGIGSRIAVADSENNSIDLYADVVMDGERWEYEVCELPPEARNPAGYTAAYDHLVKSGFDIILMDSLSHAWHGVMERVDQLSQRGDKFRAWATVSPEQREFIQTLTDPRAHLIATMRVKSEYERVTDERTGKEKIKKVGLKADQRENTEYEFDAVVRLDQGHLATVEKVRGCTALDGKSGACPGPEFWKPLFDWWLSADPVLPLFDQHANALRSAPGIDPLKAAFVRAHHDFENGRLTDTEYAELTRIKDERKTALPAADRAAELRAAVPGLKSGADVPPPDANGRPQPAGK